MTAALSTRQAWFWLLAFFALFSARASAALKPEQVPAFKIRARVTGAGNSGKIFSFQLASATSQKAEAGAWSDWMVFERAQIEKNLKDYPAIYLQRFSIVTRLRVDPASAHTTVVEAELVFDENNQIFPLHGELFGPNLGILIWRNEHQQPQAATMAEYNRRYWQPIAGLKEVPQRPRYFPIIDRFIGGDDDRTAWREGIQGLGRAGFNAIMLPPSAKIRELLLDSGLSRTACAVYNPPGYAFDYGTNINPATLRTWAHDELGPYVKAGYSAHDMSAFAMSDEPGWYYPSTFKGLTNSPTALKRFRTYVQQQGLQPSLLGAQSWDQVWPIGRSQATDLPSRRLFYWSMRFFPWDSARHFAASTRALEEAFYPDMPILVNWNFFSGRSYVPGPVANNPDKQSPDAAMGGHDWLEFGKMRGCTMLWTEDWFPDSMAYQWSFYCSKLRCAAQKSDIDFGGYIIPRTAGDREDGILQKILCVAGSGGKCLKYFVFGPEYNFPGNCYSENSRVLPKMAEAHSMIAAAEETLWPGRRPQPEVAIVMPRSSQFWDLKTNPPKDAIEDATNNHLNNHTVDYMAEVFDLYLALQHANIPVDFVDEDDLSPAALKGYQVLYLTQPNLPVRSQHGVLQWVRRGGTLARSPNAVSRDRYDEPSRVFPEMLDFLEVPRERALIPDLKALKTSGRVDDPPSSFTSIGPRSRFEKVRGKSLVKFDDGSPAIIRTKLGAGQVIQYAWFPGLTYAASASRQTGKLPTGFSETVRKWILLPVTLAELVSPVQTSRPMVETPLLLSSAGGAITLLNWTGEDIPVLRVKARVPFVPERVQSVKHGSLEFKERGKVVEFSLPLGAGDIVTLHPRR